MCQEAYRVIEALNPESIAEARSLFREYQESIGIDLSFQNFTSELETLPGEYGPPRGRLLMAKAEQELVGCVAMRPYTTDMCEMKRLYVRPRFRAAGVGRGLVERLISEARKIGYRRMVLDTLQTMTGAQRLYENLGFRDIPPYCDNPFPHTRFLSLEL
jgi:GNAT superfamily N-acetyltransferase